MSRYSRKKKSCNISNFLNFLIPYDDFYTEDDKYIIKIDFLDKTVDLKVKVAGEDSTYNPPNELARILFILGGRRCTFPSLCGKVLPQLNR